MEQTNCIDHILELMEKPAFCVQSGVITYVNQAAKKRQIATCTDIYTLLPEHEDAYRSFTGGCLYLNICIMNISCGASVSRTGDTDIFVLEYPNEIEQLETLSLAANQLRVPLSNLMAVMDTLFYQQNAAGRTAHAKVNRELHRLHRVVNNMADSAYLGKDNSNMETLDIAALLEEVMDKAVCYLAKAQITLSYTGPNESVYSLADRQLLERAIYNLISNAAKFSAKTTHLSAKLILSGSLLRFEIQNHVADAAMQADVFTRYLRQPGLEDSRFGIGLGMALIRSAATMHGGTVLVDQPEADYVRVSMTLKITKSASLDVRSPIMRISDYAGGRDHALLELCDILPAQVYLDDTV